MSAELELFLNHHGERREERGRHAVGPQRLFAGARDVDGDWAGDGKGAQGAGWLGRGCVLPVGLVPRYVRRARGVEAVIPWLYLKGVSTGNMQEALTALLGEQAQGISASVVSRLKAGWTKEYEAWRRRELGKERWV